MGTYKQVEQYSYMNFSREYHPSVVTWLWFLVNLKESLHIKFSCTNLHETAQMPTLIILDQQIVQLHHLDESISSLKAFRWIFSLLFYYYSLHRNSHKQTVLTLIRCHTLWHLNWVYTVCISPKNGYRI